MIIKLIGAALVLGSLTMGAGMATGVAAADPAAPDPTASEFGHLTVTVPAPSGGESAPGDLERGLLDGLSGHRPNPGLTT